MPATPEARARTRAFARVIGPAHIVAARSTPSATVSARCWTGSGAAAGHGHSPAKIRLLKFAMRLEALKRDDHIQFAGGFLT
jgi:hypothetical protein